MEELKELDKIVVDPAPTVEELEDEAKENNFEYAREMDTKDRFIQHLLEEVAFYRDLLSQSGKVSSAPKAEKDFKPIEPIQKVKTWRSVAQRARASEEKERQERKEIINAGKKPSSDPSPSVS